MNEGPLIGSDFADRYRLIEVIGEGGMGRVFRAEQLDKGEPVALKLLHPEFADVEQVVKRFEREAKLMTQLAHPNIVKVVEFREWQGRLFLAMELLTGKSLAELITRDGEKGRRRLTVKRTLKIIRPVLDALAYAHDLGVVHRDLKPENIMVIPGRGLLAAETIKLLDFGIARLGKHSEKAAQKLTQQGLLLGTPDYMSPEQAVGQDADARSDLYSCGVMLYQMLTGHKPFEADSSLDVLVMHVNAQPKRLREVAPSAVIPLAVERVVLRALAKRPAERFQSARELRDELERAALSSSVVGVSGLERTILAGAPARSQRRPPLIRFAIIAGAMAMVLGHHLRPGFIGDRSRLAPFEREPAKGRTAPINRGAPERGRPDATGARPHTSAPRGAGHTGQRRAQGAAPRPDRQPAHNP